MKEIGGYIEFERYHGAMLHEDGLKLNCARSCLAYLILAKHIRKLSVPFFMCDAVFDLCRSYGVELRFYLTGSDLRPKDLDCERDDFILLANNYGQLTETEIAAYKKRFPNLIVDNTQAYFQEPLAGTDTMYTCRKYFGVADGGILYTGTVLEKDLEKSESFENMKHVLGRFERNASEFYQESVANNRRLTGVPILRMSELTENILHSLNYSWIGQVRTENFAYLHERFRERNQLNMQVPYGAFSYPLMVDKAPEIRRRLAAKKIYIPVLWPNVTKQCAEDSLDFSLANNIMPLPVDQRYSLEDMKYLADMVEELL